MPLIEVKLFDFRMSEETSARLIEKMTDALCEATGVEGHSPKHWGVGGVFSVGHGTPPAGS